jgi:aminoglycoside phosphotransferase (APT) family kinase protein
MINATGARIRWADLPEHVRSAVEDILESPVVAAESQAGGFSPGTAERVVTARGTRAFVKAVSPQQNPVSPGMHRREARNTGALPPGTPAPALLGSYDDGEWIAMVLTDIDGRHPVTPWARPEIDAVTATLDAMATLLTPAPIADLPTAAEMLRKDCAGWARIAADPPPDLDPWVRERLPELTEKAAHAERAVAGDTVVHLDVRADNLLIGPAGEVTLVDWPWACRGPRWLDRLLLLVNVRLYGGHDCEAMLRDLDGDEDDMRSVLIGLTGYFVDAARNPPPPGLPTLRAFQRAQADALLPWIAGW